MERDKNVIRVHVAVFFEDAPDVLKLALVVKEIFSTMFPNEPQIIPLPPDAPADAPRCIFQNTEGSANLTFSLSRMDLDNSLIVGSPWKNHIEVIELAFISICKNCNIRIKRLGIVVQTLIDDELIQKTNERIKIEDFCKSDEKNISWVVHEHLSDSLMININTNIQINSNNIDFKGVMTLDVNTSIDSSLPNENKDLTEVVSLLLNRIEVGMKNVF